jgi:tellurite resistance protein TerC
VFIGAGIALIQKFNWIIYVFGAVLIISGLKMAFEKNKEVHPEKIACSNSSAGSCR